MRSSKLFFQLAGTGIFLALATPASARSVAITTVCKSDGVAPTDGSCAGKGGFVVTTGFESATYEQCLDRAAGADKIPPHFTPWSPAEGTAVSADAEAEEAKALARRTSYCRGIYPNLNSAGTATMAWSSAGDYSTKVALSLGTEAECVARLKAADEIPLVAGEWKTDIEDFCQTKGTPADAQAPAGSSGSGKYRSRWVQVGGSWSTPWVPGHDGAYCNHGIGCACGGQSFCGKIEAGKTAMAWPNGCAAAGWTLRCESEAEAGGGSGDREEGIKFWVEAKFPPQDDNRLTCQMFKSFTGEGTQCSDKAGTYCSQMRGNAISGGLSFHVMECKLITPGK
jgi:hypothetical protein